MLCLRKFLNEKYFIFLAIRSDRPGERDRDSGKKWVQCCIQWISVAKSVHIFVGNTIKIVKLFTALHTSCQHSVQCTHLRNKLMHFIFVHRHKLRQKGNAILFLYSSSSLLYFFLSTRVFLIHSLSHENSMSTSLHALHAMSTFLPSTSFFFTCRWLRKTLYVLQSTLYT